jgi:2-polyprenyl-3-methyl-5-hydroxy-6-metoxy-1,4-benzoquinol methylase
MPLVTRLIGLLDNPFLWRSSRWGLNVLFGLYRHRLQLMKTWGVLEDSPSILDIGCGIGHYAQATEGKYLGIDLSERYIQCARKRFPQASKEFRCIDVTTLWQEQARHDIVLLVDLLHHLADRDCIKLLQMCGQLASRHLVSFEPVTEQTNAVGRWIIKNDRGNYIRRLERLRGLFMEAGLPIVQSVELYLGPIRTQAMLVAPAADISIRAA